MDKEKLLDYVDEISEDINEVSLKIWANPEISGKESFSANVHRDILVKNDFKIVNIEEMEHAFYADYGSGKPVIAVLGEYDALPDLSQKLGTEYDPVETGGPGHGCGHNLLGSAALGGALAIKNIWRRQKSGTIRFYGCPEEETLNGKVEMVKYKAFDGCDLALSWHPMTSNVAVREAFLANNSIKFRFKGVSAHAAQSPESGRSALDSVEIMNVGANYLREHIIDDARVHYTITNAGGAPNIVPKDAESWYFVRAPRRKDVEAITERLIDIARGAALMNGTEMEYEVISGCYEMLRNDVLYELTYKNMNEIDTPKYTEEELDFARKLQESLDKKLVEGEIRKLTPDADPNNLPPIHMEVLPEENLAGVSLSGSSDSGDVSWIMPMNLFLTATWPLGIAPHSWQATSSSGSSLGTKGMIYSAKIFTGMMYDLLNDESLVDGAIEEFNERTKVDKYISPLR